VVAEILHSIHGHTGEGARGLVVQGKSGGLFVFIGGMQASGSHSRHFRVLAVICVWRCVRCSSGCPIPSSKLAGRLTQAATAAAVGLR
jgi:hypothetical protein